jgi:hypothetical protein
VWKLAGVPTAVIHDPKPDHDTVSGTDGDVRVSFGGLVQGLAYGLCWSH